MRSDHAPIAGRRNARPAATEHGPASRSEELNRVLATNLDQPEGPALLADGTLALVEMGEARASVTLLGNGGRKVLSRPGGRPTGLALDGDGCLWVAGGTGNSLVRLSPTGELLMTIGGDEDGPFLFPNDLAFGPDGLLYLTDSGMLPENLISGLAIRPDFASADYDGRVFQIDPRRGRVLRRMAAGMRFANGIAFGADGGLYVAETLTGIIHRLDPDDGHLEPFAWTTPEPPIDRFRGPDGMAFDMRGTLHVAQYGEGRVAVFAADGSELPSIGTNGDRPTNLALRPDAAEMLVTEVENGAVEIIAVDASALPLFAPRIGT